MRGCGDVARVGAFVGIALAQDFALTIAFAAAGRCGNSALHALPPWPGCRAWSARSAFRRPTRSMERSPTSASPPVRSSRRVVLVVAGPEEILLRERRQLRSIRVCAGPPSFWRRTDNRCSSRRLGQLPRCFGKLAKELATVARMRGYPSRYRRIDRSPFLRRAIQRRGVAVRD